MKKILLVYDDFNEMTLTESFLKKIGFDVIGISNEYLIAGQLLSFNPDVVIAFGHSPKVNTIAVSIRLKEQKKFAGKVILILPPKVTPTMADLAKMRMDVVLESPISQVGLIGAIAQLMEKDETELTEKLKKFVIQQTDNEPVTIKNLKSKSRDRNERYLELTKGIQFDTKKSSHSKAEVRERNRKMTEGYDKAELEKQDQLKRDFTSALFETAVGSAAHQSQLQSQTKSKIKAKP